MLPLRICIYYEEVIFSKYFEEFEELPLYPGLSKAVHHIECLRNKHSTE